jgi:archaellum component FlaC
MELEIGGRSMSGIELVEIRLEDLARVVERVRQSALEFEEAILQKDWEKADELHADLDSQFSELSMFIEDVGESDWLQEVGDGSGEI